MKKNLIKMSVLGMLIFGGTTVFSASALNNAASTHCNSGDTGVCNNVTEGKACKRINPEYIGDCGGTSEDEVVVN